MFKTLSRFFSTSTKKIMKNSIVGNKLISEEVIVDRSPNLLSKKSNTNLQQVYETNYDVIIVGAGHNGLICANYLAKAGKKVLVIEKRHEIGGAAITEELVEGYKISRCSYVLSLFRKCVINELFGQEFFNKVKLFKRDPHSFTPLLDGRYLLFGSNSTKNKEEIAKFSLKDSEAYEKFETSLKTKVSLINPLIDNRPIDGYTDLSYKNFKFLLKIFLHVIKNRANLIPFYHFLTSSAGQFLDEFFESEVLKSTLATDAVIGAMKSPKSLGSAYILLHHVMGEIDEHGSWFYVKGGTGTVSKFFANEAMEKGVEILVNSPVERLLINNGKIEGVRVNEKELKSEIVVTNCDHYNTYFKLLDEEQRSKYLKKEDEDRLSKIDYSSPVFKINLIVNKLPLFKCLKNVHNNDSKINEDISKQYLTGTIHMNSETMEQIEEAYNQAIQGLPSDNPIIEMTIPSILDKSLVPEGSGHHVIGLFTQYAPNKLLSGDWNEEAKREYARRVYRDIEKYCEGFTDSIIYEDLLSPKDLEKEFSLTGGNIFHGSLDINSIYFCRPIVGFSGYESKIKNLYSCSSGMHPGGGIMGAVGRNCAIEALRKFKV